MNKFRNKITGEIVEQLYAQFDNKFVTSSHPTFGSIADFNDTWEDYEEVHEYWFISNDGYANVADDTGAKCDQDRKAIGNYFETKEACDEAIEKLKESAKGEGDDE